MPIDLFDQPLNGTLLPLLQEESYDFDPSRGYVYHAEYKGLSRGAMQLLANYYTANGITCRLQTRYGVTTLTATDPTQAWDVDTWQVEGGEERIDGFSHPDVIAAVNDAAPSETAAQNFFAAIRQHLENQDAPATAFVDPNLAPWVGDSFLKRIYSLNQRGSPEFENDALGGGYILKHTTNVSNRWTVNVSDFGVGQIYTPAQLLSETQNSGYWTFPLPPRLGYKLAVIPAPDPQTDYMWGWRKSRSSENTAANNRVDIITRYTLEQWSLDYYDPY